MNIQNWKKFLINQSSISVYQGWPGKVFSRGGAGKTKNLRGGVIGKVAQIIHFQKLFGSRSRDRHFFLSQEIWIKIQKFHPFWELILWRNNVLTFFQKWKCSEIENKKWNLQKKSFRILQKRGSRWGLLNDYTRKINYSNISSNRFMVHLLFLQKLFLISENLIRKKLRSSFSSRYNTGL